MATQILRIKRTDDKNSHILLRVSQTGPKTLDLDIIGTEQFNVFHGAIKESDVKSLQSNNFSGDLQEWKEILNYAFLHHRPEGPTPEALQGIETVASIKGKTLEVNLRKNTGGIVQRLGSVKLEEESLEVSAFDWVDTAVSISDDLRSQLETLQASVSEQREQVVKLTKQLDELVQAKREHEEELLNKFMPLLNAKKLKIRDQQRLLAGAKIDRGTAEAVNETRSSRSAPGRKAGGSRRWKRKMDEQGDDKIEEDLDEGSLEADEEERQQEETPPPSDDEMTDDEEDLNEFAPASSSSRTVGADANGTSSQRMEIDEDEELPPRRELPFKKKSAPPAAAEQAEPSANADDDDDETDEEL